MDATTARSHLIHLKKWFATDDNGNPTDKYRSFIEALDVALDAVAPLMGAGRCAWVYLPDEDLMPYEHIALCTKLTKALYPDRPDRPPDVKCLTMALMVYKSVLMNQHRERIRAELEKARAARGGELRRPTDG